LESKGTVPFKKERFLFISQKISIFTKGLIISGMKIINFIFNIFIILLVILLANYFFHFIKIAGWMTVITLIVAAVLFFIRAYVRYGKR